MCTYTFICTERSYIYKIIINPHWEEVWSFFIKVYKWQILKNPIIVKTPQMPTDGKHIRQFDVLRQYRIVWTEPCERLSGNWNVATGNPDRRVTTLLWNDQSIWNTGLKYCLTHWCNYILILWENEAKEKEMEKNTGRHKEKEEEILKVFKVD